jgi:hypothetical protein
VAQAIWTNVVSTENTPSRRARGRSDRFPVVPRALRVMVSR